MFHARTCDRTIASGHAASHHTKSEPPLKLHQSKSGTGVRAEKRRGVSFETTSTKAFPVEDQPQMLLITLLITLRGYTSKIEWPICPRSVRATSPLMPSSPSGGWPRRLCPYRRGSTRKTTGSHASAGCVGVFRWHRKPDAVHPLHAGRCA